MELEKETKRLGVQVPATIPRSNISIQTDRKNLKTVQKQIDDILPRLENLYVRRATLMDRLNDEKPDLHGLSVLCFPDIDRNMPNTMELIVHADTRVNELRKLYRACMGLPPPPAIPPSSPPPADEITQPEKKTKTAPKMKKEYYMFV
jgi:hypothetical protein